MEQLLTTPLECAGTGSLDPVQVSAFEQDGYLIVRNLAPEAMRGRMLEVTLDGLSRLIEPLEFEADLHYPGAPQSLQAPGGNTVRRLKQAHSRDYVFTQWITYPPLQQILRQLVRPAPSGAVSRTFSDENFGTGILCPLAHHNCIMTKEPRFSSDTGWHQDIRYWSFTRPELVNAWLALGPEQVENGCLHVVPGSHRMNYQRHQFDGELFFRTDLEENRDLLAGRVPVILEPGDVLFFHARTLHSASRNHTDQTKYSVVFTFRSADNPPIAGSRSSASPEILFH